MQTPLLPLGLQNSAGCAEPIPFSAQAGVSGQCSAHVQCVLAPAENQRTNLYVPDRLANIGALA